MTIETHDEETDETVPLSVRIPKSLCDRVLMAGGMARCRHKTAAVIHVLENGLEYLERQRSKPMRLEKMVGRVEDLEATQLATTLELIEMMSGSIDGFPALDPEAVAARRRDIIEGL